MKNRKAIALVAIFMILWVVPTFWQTTIYSRNPREMQYQLGNDKKNYIHRNPNTGFYEYTYQTFSGFDTFIFSASVVGIISAFMMLKDKK